MSGVKGMWVRSSNHPDCRVCKERGYEWLYKVGYDVVVRVDACRRCEQEGKAKAFAALPEKYRS